MSNRCLPMRASFSISWKNRTSIPSKACRRRFRSSRRPSRAVPRSTVGTVTEIYDYLRLLFSSIGLPHCQQCGEAITRQSVEQIVQSVLALPEGERVMILAPIVRGRKGEFKKELAKLASDGFMRARVDGELLRLMKRSGSTSDAIIRSKPLSIACLIKPGINERLAESVRTALKLTGRRGAGFSDRWRREALLRKDGLRDLRHQCAAARAAFLLIQFRIRRLQTSVMVWELCSKSIRPN